MMIVKMQGGLANKMFQFAFYKNLESRGIEACMDDFSFKPAWDFEDIKLNQIFPNIEIEYANLKDVKKLGGGGDIISKIRRKYPILHKRTFIDERIKGSDPTYYNNLVGDYYLQILCSSEVYFKQIAQTIRKNFRFKDFENPINIDFSKKIASEESVAIHVRKGADYISNFKVQGTCTIEYYKKAISYMKDNIDNPKFYVFTDNPTWVKENLIDLSYSIIDWNPISGSDNYLDMQLMSNSKHNIIANSTYSWWGAWLNKNPDKIVIGPKQWFNPSVSIYPGLELLPKDWLKF